MDTTPNGGTIDGKLDTRTKDVPESVAIVPTRSAGDPECRTCGGAGGTWRQDGVWLVSPSCACASRIREMDAIERCWPPDVIKAARSRPAASALTGKTGMNLRVRAERDVLAAHLPVALSATGKIELVRIASDGDLVDAWLANVGDLRDDEAAAHRGEQEARYRSVADLVAPPKLLVLYVGIRAARLADLPDLVLEAIQVRQQRGKATWVVDTIDRPLAEGRCPAWREDLAAMLAEWPTVRLNSAQEVGEEDVDLATGTSSPLKRRPDPELLEAARRDGWTPKTIGKNRSLWGDCRLCGGTDCYGYVKNDFDGINKYCKACKGKGKAAKDPPVAPAALAPPAAPPSPAAKQTAKDALRAALGIGGSTPVSVYPADLEADGWSKSSLEKALKELRRDHPIQAKKQGDRWVWLWAP